MTERLTETPKNLLLHPGDEVSEFDIKILDEVEKLRESINEKEKRDDMEKVSRLMRQYNEFKEKNLPNFRFNPKNAGSHYGECKVNMTFGKKCEHILP